jgi:type 1 glutamine amidotransferase
VLTAVPRLAAGFARVAQRDPLRFDSGMNHSPGLFKVALLGVLLVTNSVSGAEKLKALIVDGQNNHAWQSTTPVLKWVLEQSGRFTVDIATAPESAPRPPKAPKEAKPEQLAAYETAKAQWQEQKRSFDEKRDGLWNAWRPKFSNYAVVVSNYNGELWPEEVREAFVQYVKQGGGFVAVHAADNAFPEWLEYNQMIGVGGWGGRNEKSGPMLRFRNGAMVKDETPGAGGTHGVQHEFVVESREPKHPIMAGLAPKWKHAGDELYAKLRGPAKDVTVLATAYSDPETRGTGEHEPMLMVTQFGKGRVFHTTLGHSADAMNGLGFQVTFARGCEWVATGKVSLPTPAPGALSVETASMRPMPKP